MNEKKLNKVAKAARMREQESAGHMREQQQRHEHQQQNLQQLEEFKHEYEARLLRIASTGMEARQLQDYRMFLERLSSALTRQSEDTRDSAEKVEASRQDWLEQSQRSRALDNLLDLNRQQRSLEENRQEQKRTDEMVSFRHGALSRGLPTEYVS